VPHTLRLPSRFAHSLRYAGAHVYVAFTLLRLLRCYVTLRFALVIYVAFVHVVTLYVDAILPPFAFFTRTHLLRRTLPLRFTDVRYPLFVGRSGTLHVWTILRIPPRLRSAFYRLGAFVARWLLPLRLIANVRVHAQFRSSFRFVHATFDYALRTFGYVVTHVTFTRLLRTPSLYTGSHCIVRATTWFSPARTLPVAICGCYLVCGCALLPVCHCTPRLPARLFYRTFCVRSAFVVTLLFRFPTLRLVLPCTVTFTHVRTHVAYGSAVLDPLDTTRYVWFCYPWRSVTFGYVCVGFRGLRVCCARLFAHTFTHYVLVAGWLRTGCPYLYPTFAVYLFGYNAGLRCPHRCAPRARALVTTGWFAFYVRLNSHFLGYGSTRCRVHPRVYTAGLHLHLCLCSHGFSFTRLPSLPWLRFAFVATQFTFALFTLLVTAPFRLPRFVCTLRFTLRTTHISLLLLVVPVRCIRTRCTTFAALTYFTPMDYIPFTDCQRSIPVTFCLSHVDFDLVTCLFGLPVCCHAAYSRAFTRCFVTALRWFGYYQHVRSAPLRLPRLDLLRYLLLRCGCVLPLLYHTTLRFHTHVSAFVAPWLRVALLVPVTAVRVYRLWITVLWMDAILRTHLLYGCVCIIACTDAFAFRLCLCIGCRNLPVTLLVLNHSYATARCYVCVRHFLHFILLYLRLRWTPLFTFHRCLLIHAPPDSSFPVLLLRGLLGSHTFCVRFTTRSRLRRLLVGVRTGCRCHVYVLFTTFWFVALLPRCLRLPFWMPDTRCLLRAPLLRCGLLPWRSAGDFVVRSYTGFCSCGFSHYAVVHCCLPFTTALFLLPTHIYVQLLRAVVARVCVVAWFSDAPQVRPFVTHTPPWLLRLLLPCVLTFCNSITFVYTVCLIPLHWFYVYVYPDYVTLITFALHLPVPVSHTPTFCVRWLICAFITVVFYFIPFVYIQTGCLLQLLSFYWITRATPHVLRWVPLPVGVCRCGDFTFDCAYCCVLALRTRLLVAAALYAFRSVTLCLRFYRHVWFTRYCRVTVVAHRCVLLICWFTHAILFAFCHLWFSCVYTHCVRLLRSCLCGLPFRIRVATVLFTLRLHCAHVVRYAALLDTARITARLPRYPGCCPRFAVCVHACGCTFAVVARYACVLRVLDYYRFTWFCHHCCVTTVPAPPVLAFAYLLLYAPHAPPAAHVCGLPFSSRVPLLPGSVVGTFAFSDSRSCTVTPAAVRPAIRALRLLSVTARLDYVLALPTHVYIRYTFAFLTFRLPLAGCVAWLLVFTFTLRVPLHCCVTVPALHAHTRRVRWCVIYVVYTLLHVAFDSDCTTQIPVHVIARYVDCVWCVRFALPFTLPHSILFYRTLHLRCLCSLPYLRVCYTFPLISGRYVCVAVYVSHICVNVCYATLRCRCSFCYAPCCLRLPLRVFAFVPVSHLPFVATVIYVCRLCSAFRFADCCLFVDFVTRYVDWVIITGALPFVPLRCLFDSFVYCFVVFIYALPFVDFGVTLRFMGVVVTVVPLPCYTFCYAVVPFWILHRFPFPFYVVPRCYCRCVTRLLRFCRCIHTQLLHVVCSFPHVLRVYTFGLRLRCYICTLLLRLRLFRSALWLVATLRCVSPPCAHGRYIVYYRLRRTFVTRLRYAFCICNFVYHLLPFTLLPCSVCRYCRSRSLFVYVVAIVLRCCVTTLLLFLFPVTCRAVCCGVVLFRLRCSVRYTFTVHVTFGAVVIEFVCVTAPLITFTRLPHDCNVTIWLYILIALPYIVWCAVVVVVTLFITLLFIDEILLLLHIVVVNYIYIVVVYLLPCCCYPFVPTRICRLWVPHYAEHRFMIWNTFYVELRYCLHGFARSVPATPLFVAVAITFTHLYPSWIPSAFATTFHTPTHTLPLVQIAIVYTIHIWILFVVRCWSVEFAVVYYVVVVRLLRCYIYLHCCLLRLLPLLRCLVLFTLHSAIHIVHVLFRLPLHSILLLRCCYTFRHLFLMLHCCICLFVVVVVVTCCLLLFYIHCSVIVDAHIMIHCVLLWDCCSDDCCCYCCILVHPATHVTGCSLNFILPVPRYVLRCVTLRCIVYYIRCLFVYVVPRCCYVDCILCLLYIYCFDIDIVLLFIIIIYCYIHCYYLLLLFWWLLLLLPRCLWSLFITLLLYITLLFVVILHCSVR